MSNMFNVLYHRYIQQIKIQEIQNYNNKHKQYLRRVSKNVNPQSKDYINKVESKKTNNRSNGNNQRTNQYANERPIQSSHQERRIVNENNNVGTNNNSNKRVRQFLATRNNNKITDQYQSNNSNYDNMPIKPNQNFKQTSQTNKPQNPNQQKNQLKNKKFQSEQREYLAQINNQKKSVPQNFKYEQQQRSLKAATKKNNQFENQLPEEEGEVVLEQCPEGCGRKFNQKALQKHIKVCRKIFQQKRKPFKVDVVDDQAKKLATKNQKKNEKIENKKSQKVPKWKKQSQLLRRGLQAQSQAGSKEGGSSQSLPIEQQDDRIQCGGCGRKFNQTAAQKHIPNCIKRNKQKK